MVLKWIEPNRSQFNSSSAALQDHERVERGDAVVATDVGECCGVAQAAVGDYLECDRGVCGGDAASELRSPCSI